MKEYFNESDYLNYDNLNDIENKVRSVCTKFSSILQQQQTNGSLYNLDDILFIQDISLIEKRIEYIGNMLGYPTGWIKSKQWNENGFEIINNSDINRIYNNLKILENVDTINLLPSNGLYPREDLYPTCDFTSNYTKLEYLESTGTQYIDTKIYATNKTKIEMEIEDIKPVSKITGIFGVYSGNRFLIYGNANNKFSAGFGGSYSASNISIEDNKIYKLYLASDGFKINNELVWTSTSSTFNISGKSMYVFKRNYSSDNSFISMKLKSFKIWEDNVLIANYIPCKSKIKNELGLYNTITSEFLTNEGTGTFKGE